MTAPLASGAVALLAGAALKGTVVLLAALAVTRAMRRRSAASRHLVWAIALAAVVALPALSLVVPAWRVVPIPTLARDAAQPNVVTLSSDPAPVASNLASSGADLSIDPSASTASQSPSAIAPEPKAAGFAFDWRAGLLVLWALGGALLVARLAYGVARVWWIQRRAVEITDENWVRITDALARRLRVGRIVTLLREARASVPMTWGVFRPVVLLPEEADAWDAERRTVVLAHELAHVRRWDAATQWIAHAALALFWFNPLVWLAARRLREEREHACDDAVLAIGTRPVEYADHLLSIVRSLGTAEGPVAALAMARRSQFEGRLLAILDQGTARGGVRRGFGAAALVLAAACMLPLAALRAAVPSPDAAGSRSVTDPRARTAEHPALAEHGPEGSAATSVDGESAKPGDATASAGALAKLDRAATEREKRETGDADPSAGSRTIPLVTAVGAAAASNALAAPGGVRVGADTVSLLTIAAEIKSDSEKGTLLRGLVSRQGTGPEQLLEIVRAAGTIRSPSDRASVLVAVLSSARATPAVVTEALRVAGTGSDGETRYVLGTAVGRHALAQNQAAVRAYLDAVGGVRSDGERRYLLVSLLNEGALSEAALVEVLRLAGGIDSDGEKRYILSVAAGQQRLGARAQTQYLQVARGIDSEGERAYALSMLMREGDEEARPAAGARADDTRTRPAQPASATRAGASRTRTEDGRTKVWNGTHEVVGERDGVPVRVLIEAREVLQSRNAWDVVAIRPGGVLRVEEDLGPVRRRLVIRPGANGHLVRTYHVNGQERPFDAEAERWMAQTIRRQLEP